MADVPLGSYEPIFDSDTPAEVMAAAQRWLNVSSAQTRIFLRMKGTQPIGVSLLFGAHYGHLRPGLAFVPAEDLGLRRQYEPPASKPRGEWNG
jgi:hypothetical protein